MTTKRGSGSNPSRTRTRAGRLQRVAVLLPAVLFLATLTLVVSAPSVPTEIDQPGTQPGEVASYSSACSCHYQTSNPQWEPGFGWEGSMMGNASRDPIFWATVAIAEQDFVADGDPEQRGGAGDLCIRCHSVGGWINGNSTPTDGSGLAAAEDRGVECEFCHLLVNPDPPVNVTGTVEEQNAPFEAYDPSTGEPYYGSGQYVINSEGTRLGPYAEGDHQARHQAYGSPFHRQAELCGTCHDVSNPAVGDLAHNHGAQEVMLAPGSYSGTLGSPVDGKAAFNNPPYAYGIVERTFSEWKSSNWPATRVNDFASLPAELQHVGGAPDIAFHRAWDARLDADYEDGTPRFYTCQTCHMYARTGVGCDKNNMPVRTDLPQHDHMGGGYWIPDVIQYQEDKGTLLFGGGLDADKRAAMNDAKQRAADQLTRAGSVEATQVGASLRVRVTNLTGHKLISGYPEGRRMWLNLIWKDGGGAVIREDGAYGPLPRPPVNDLDGNPHQPESILDLDGTVIYEAEPGMDQGWAAQLSSLGYPDGMVLGYDRLTDAVYHTLGELRTEQPGEAYHTFHFVLNNVVTHDNRIPPYGMRYDDARTRNALPVPKTQYGDPGPGGVYQHWDENDFAIPGGAATAEVRLYYQQTSWEYIQFLWLNNDGLSAFLGNEGVNMLDAWLNTGMSPPYEMAGTTVSVSSTSGVPGQASRQDVPGEQLIVSAYDEISGEITIAYTPGCDAQDHAIHFGDLAGVASYTYTGAGCSIGTSGTAVFDPGPGDVFFLVVAHDSADQGSYGEDSLGAERLDDAARCGMAQNLGGVVCE